MVVFKSKQKAADTVEKWLKEEDYDVTLVPDESADYNFMIVKGYKENGEYSLEDIRLFKTLYLIV